MLLQIDHAKGSDSSWRSDTQVLGVVVNGQPVAYPLSMLMWHWVINDEVAGQPVVIAFCRICGSGAVYRRSFDDTTVTFGTSGLIYDNDMLLYDAQSQSLWSWGNQIAVTGPYKNRSLELIVSNLQPLADWLELHPSSLVAAHSTAKELDYHVTPNGTSAIGESVYSGLLRTVGQLPPSMPVLLTSIDQQITAFPASEVLDAGGVILDGDQGALSLTFDVASQKFVVDGNADTKQLKLLELFARHPNARVFKADAIEKGHAE